YHNLLSQHFDTHQFLIGLEQIVFDCWRLQWFAGLLTHVQKYNTSFQIAVTIFFATGTSTSNALSRTIWRRLNSDFSVPPLCSPCLRGGESEQNTRPGRFLLIPTY